MKSLEFSAKTVEEAIRRALDQLGVSREEVEISVVREGKAGILGIGAEDAVVRVTPLVKTPEVTGEGNVTEVAREVLEKLLGLMGLTVTVTAEERPMAGLGEEESSTSIILDVKGEDLGILIGRRGQTLAGLQYLLRLIVGHRTKKWLPIFIDVEGYKQRRYESLQSFAQHMAEQVRARGVPFTLEPMPPYERRIIHLTLANDPYVTTQSTGEGESRKVVILPRKKSPPQYR